LIVIQLIQLAARHALIRATLPDNKAAERSIALPCFALRLLPRLIIATGQAAKQLGYATIYVFNKFKHL